MAKHLIAIGRPTDNGLERVEIGTFLVEATVVTLSDPDVKRKVEDVLHIPICAFPTDKARNVLVQKAKERHVDFLFMVDSDAAPAEGWFKTALLYLMQNKYPCFVAAPYVSADGTVQVMEYRHTDPEPTVPLERWALKHLDRLDASRRSGIEKVHSVGTHCVAYDMRVFDLVKQPYFYYQYNHDHTDVEGTEDVMLHNNLYYANVECYVTWDFWAAHYKTRRLQGPVALDPKLIPEYFRQQAK